MIGAHARRIITRGGVLWESSDSLQTAVATIGYAAAGWRMVGSVSFSSTMRPVAVFEIGMW